ncbi:hypothetical protein OIU84_026863 [Salix udensis]|uniref:Uncharacterized protein n=1 Tax=Salix udensis TaxID=889485 RepID=A0AAD6PA31_9ROSI|nr:hypothetical protein OIU84_026863 [Salix udensis]
MRNLDQSWTDGNYSYSIIGLMDSWLDLLVVVVVVVGRCSWLLEVIGTWADGQRAENRIQIGHSSTRARQWRFVGPTLSFLVM